VVSAHSAESERKFRHTRHFTDFYRHPLLNAGKTSPKTEAVTRTASVGLSVSLIIQNSLRKEARSAETFVAVCVGAPLAGALVELQ
jgi:hypothetical protein